VPGLEALIRQQAAAEGFEAVRLVKLADDPEQARRLQRYLAEGRHGTMAWMERGWERRSSPLTLWPEARSAVVVAQVYGASADPFARLQRRDTGVISLYALGRDYHDVLKGKLRRLARWLGASSGADARIFVDTAPLMEKPLAARAGLGWQGKHTNLLSRELGSWFFLGVILTSAELAPDAPETDHCGSCRACLDICPTKALPAPYEIDARRCISYLTIEHRGHIDIEFRRAIGNRIYGCDDCLAVCPWNKFARKASEARLNARAELLAPDLAFLLGLDDAAFRRLFAGSPVKRTGRDRFLRNVLIAAGNSGLPGLAAFIRPLLEDGSPLVRAMAIWAFRALAEPADVAAMRERCLAGEADPAVRREWQG
jgi:epoxyqueuosine reductase